MTNEAKNIDKCKVIHTGASIKLQREDSDCKKKVQGETFESTARSPIIISTIFLAFILSKGKHPLLLPTLDTNYFSP